MRSTVLRACSSAGRAPALQAGGQGFESPHVHQNFTPLLSATYAATSSPDFAPDFLGAFGTITAASSLFPHSPNVTFGKAMTAAAEIPSETPAEQPHPAANCAYVTTQGVCGHELAEGKCRF